MKKAAGNWVNLTASIGVILGIIFLGMEINQNTEMMKSQARDAISEKQMMFSEWVTTEPEMAEALAKASTDYASLSPAERVMFAYFQAGVWREWENSHYQFERGLFDAREFEPRMARWRSHLLSPAAREQWRISRDWYAPTFRQQVDRIVESIEAQAPEREAEQGGPEKP